MGMIVPFWSRVMSINAHTRATTMSTRTARMLPGGQPKACRGGGRVGTITTPGSVRGACVLMPNLLPQTAEAGFRAGGRGYYPLRRWPPEDWQPQGVDTPARRPCNAISARLAPGLVLAQHLGPTAPRPVDHPRPEFVVPL